MGDELLIGCFGLIIGFIGGYAGIGGAPLLAFLMGFFLSMPQHKVQGTVLAIMLGPMTLPGLFVMKERIRPLLLYSVICVVTYAIFSYVGAAFAYRFSSDSLKLLFSIFLMLLGLRYLISGMLAKVEEDGEEGEEKSALIPLNALTILPLGCLVGVVGGLFGIGAGILIIPILMFLYGMDKDDARTLSLLILLPPVSVGAVVRYHQNNDVLWPAVLVAFCSYFASNYWGAKLGKRHSAKQFSVVLGLLLALCGIAYVFK